MVAMAQLKRAITALLNTKELRLKAIVALGVLGMLLVLISQFMPAKKPAPSGDTALFTAGEYAASLEARLTELISGMEGAGRVRLMVTLENAGETVYAQEEVRNVDKHEEAVPTLETAAKTVSQKENVEQRYILVEGENGRREALVEKELEPRIQGVVVLCEGAGRPAVVESITHVVTTALNIPTTRVCVVKISNQPEG
jgi:stage III sporulation protein AG